VVADFDRTITKASHQGRGVLASYAIVGTYEGMSERYRKEIDATRTHYIAIEMGPLSSNFHFNVKENILKRIDFCREMNYPCFTCLLCLLFLSSFL